jgi:hypothetical protein
MLKSLFVEAAIFFASIFGAHGTQIVRPHTQPATAAAASFPYPLQFRPFLQDVLPRRLHEHSSNTRIAALTSSAKR